MTGVVNIVYLFLWNPGQTSQENQNRDISGLEKGAYVLRLKKKYIATWGDKNIEPLVCGQYGYLTVVFKMAVQEVANITDINRTCHKYYGSKSVVVTQLVPFLDVASVKGPSRDQ